MNDKLVELIKDVTKDDQETKESIGCLEVQVRQLVNENVELKRKFDELRGYYEYISSELDTFMGYHEADKNSPGKYLNYKEYVSSLKEKKKQDEWERVLLTDRSELVNFDPLSVQREIDSLNKKVNEHGVLYGEFGSPDTLDISLKNVSHSVRNVELCEDGIYGEVRFLTTDIGKVVKEMYENDRMKFKLRAVFTPSDNEIKKVFTWDLVFKK